MGMAGKVVGFFATSAEKIRAATAKAVGDRSNQSSPNACNKAAEAVVAQTAETGNAGAESTTTQSYAAALSGVAEPSGQDKTQLESGKRAASVPHEVSGLALPSPDEPPPLAVDCLYSNTLGCLAPEALHRTPGAFSLGEVLCGPAQPG